MKHIQKYEPTIRAGAGTNCNDSNTPNTFRFVLITYSATSNQYSALYRGFTFFDTSALDDSAASTFTPEIRII